MAVKNIFSRGVGFTSGVVSWVVTRGFGTFGTPVVPVVFAKSPTYVTLASSRTRAVVTSVATSAVVAASRTSVTITGA